MYKINDFSIKTGVSKDTLRYYDNIDLFKPSYVDIFSGYRYYLDEQIPIINKISDLKELNLSLSEIKEYLKCDDVDILIKKRKEMKVIMNKIDELINKNEYSIKECNYKKYVEINGIKSSKSPNALEVRDGSAYYYVIEKNNEFFNDFCIYNESNWITIDRKLLLNKELMTTIFGKIKEVFEYIIVYIPIENEKIISDIINLYPECIIEAVKQGNWIYKKIKIIS